MIMAGTDCPRTAPALRYSAKPLIAHQRRKSEAKEAKQYLSTRKSSQEHTGHGRDHGATEKPFGKRSRRMAIRLDMGAVEDHHAIIGMHADELLIRELEEDRLLSLS